MGLLIADTNIPPLTEDLAVFVSDWHRDGGPAGEFLLHFEGLAGTRKLWVDAEVVARLLKRAEILDDPNAWVWRTL